MIKITAQYNKGLVFGFVFAPFIAYLLVIIFNMGFNRVFQALSYLGVFLVVFFRDNKNPIKLPNYLIFYFLFIVYVFFSTFFLLDRSFKFEYLFSNFLIGGFNMMFIIENLKFDRLEFKKIILYSKYILIIAFFTIMYQQTINPLFFVSPGDIEEVARFGSDRNRLQSIYSWIGSLTIGFGFVPVFLLVVDELEAQKKNVLMWVILGLTIAFLSKARWVMVNTLFVFILLGINNWSRSRELFKYLFLIPILITGFYFFLELSGNNASAIIRSRILESDKGNLSQTSAGTRILAFEAFNRLYWDNPILGVGDIKYGMGGTGEQDYKLRSFLQGRSSQIHVGYLSLFYKYGMIGGMFFMAFLYLLLKKLYKNAKQNKKWAPFLGFLGFAVANWTLVIFSVFEMGLIIVLVADKYYRINESYD